MKPDDLLQKIDDKEIAGEVDLETVLSKHKPRASVRLTVQRKAGDTESKTLFFKASLSEPPLDIVRMQDDLAREGIPGNLVRPSLMTTLSKVDGTEAIPGDETIPGLEPTLKAPWSAKRIDVSNGMGIEFTMPLQSYLAGGGVKANLELVKRYRLFKANRNANVPATPETLAYHLDVENVVRNLDDQAHEVALRQESMNGLTLEAWWYAIKLSQSFMSAAGHAM